MIEGRREVLSPEQIAKNVDRYLAELNARGKARVQLALIALAVWPMLTLRPPLPTLAPSTRKRFLEKRFIEDVAARRVFRPLRPIVQVMIRTGAQMSYLGYYGDRRSWHSIGYTPYQDRRPDGRAATPNDPPEPALRSPDRAAARRAPALRHAWWSAPARPARSSRSASPRPAGACSCSSAARTSTRGSSPTTRSTSTCGSTTRARSSSRRTSASRSCRACASAAGRRSTTRSASRRPIRCSTRGRSGGSTAPGSRRRSARSARCSTSRRSASGRRRVAARRFATAVGELGLPGTLDLMEANITAACRGCGYCNIGCAYGAKRAALDALLPWAQEQCGLELLAGRRGRADPDRRRPRRRRCRPTRAERRAVLDPGRRGRRRGRPDRLELAAAAQRPRRRPGRRRAALQHQLAADRRLPRPGRRVRRDPDVARVRRSRASRRTISSRPGSTRPPPRRSRCPAGSTATSSNMDRYRHMACAGVLVGTTTPGRVKPTKDGPEIEYEASKADRDRLVEGLGVAGRIWLHAGAERVMPATFAWQEYRTAASLDGLAPSIRETGDLLMTSAHPQGGNAMGDVVDERLPRPRLREPVAVRRERVPVERAREPAADGDGDGAVRRTPDPRSRAPGRHVGGLSPLTPANVNCAGWGSQCPPAAVRVHNCTLGPHRQTDTHSHPSGADVRRSLSCRRCAW